MLHDGGSVLFRWLRFGLLETRTRNDDPWKSRHCAGLVLKAENTPPKKDATEPAPPEKVSDVDALIYDRGFQDGYFDACSRMATGFLIILSVWIVVRLLTPNE